jgi:hypothetical protein
MARYRQVLKGHKTWVAIARGRPFNVVVSLGDSGPYCRLGQVEVPGRLVDRAVTASAVLDDLGPEFGGARPAGTGLLSLHGLHMGILSGAAYLMVDIRQSGEPNSSSTYEDASESPLIPHFPHLFAH